MFRRKKRQDPFKAIQECLQKREYKEALNWFHTLLKRDPKNTQIRLRFADTLVLAGSRKEAVKQFRKVADQLADKGFMIRAIAINKKILKLDPTQQDVHEKLAEINQERAETAAEGTLGRSLAQRSPSTTSEPEPEPIPEPEPEPEPIAPDPVPTVEVAEPAAAVAEVAAAASPEAAEQASSSLPESLSSLEESMAMEFGEISADSPTAVIEPEAVEESPAPADALSAAMDDVAAAVASSPEEPAVGDAEPSAGGDDVVVLDFEDIEAVTPDEPAEINLEPSDEAVIEEVTEAVVEASAVASEDGGFAGFADSPSIGIELDDPLAESAPEAPSLDLSDEGAVLELDVGASPQEGEESGPLLELEPESEIELEPEIEVPSSDRDTGPETVPVIDVADRLASFAEPTFADAEVAPSEDEDPDQGFVIDDEGFELEELEVELDSDAAADGAHALIGELDEDVDSLIDSIISDMDVPSTSMDEEVEPAPTHIPLFSDLTMPEFVDVAILLLRRVAKPGEEIVQQGEPGSSMYIISTGEVKAMVDRGGQQLPVATLKDGQFFGEMALLSGEPRSATIVATKNTELLELNKENFDEICRRHPHVDAKIRLAYDERTSRA